MGYIQLILAAIQVAKEFIIYLRKKEERTAKAKCFVNNLKQARKEGNTDEIERIFGRPSGDVDKL